MFPGATIAPDGSLILLIDVNRLVAGESIEHRPLMTSANAARVFAPGAEAVAHGAIPQAAIDFIREEKLVVLVDDSISVRKFVGRMLEKAGYRVKLAADGLEALEIVTQTKCDLVVTDLEMPRTNGYELLSHLRQDPHTRGIPVMVDDSISVRKFVGSMLEKAGYRVKLAADGLEALEIVTQTKCDLVVTDLEMPRTNGYELLSHLRQDAQTRGIPVMVVTSRAGAKHRERAMKEGAAAFLTKPVQEDQFIAAVNNLIGAPRSAQVERAAAVGN